MVRVSINGDVCGSARDVWLFKAGNSGDLRPAPLYILLYSNTQRSFYFKTTHGTKKMWSYIAGGLIIKVIEGLLYMSAISELRTVHNDCIKLLYTDTDFKYQRTC